jgi:uncharacterized BrkB/YihY/UPF0761 family membrane protein
VRLEGIKKALARTYGDVLRNHTMQMAAALSYYFVLSLFPALIFLSAVVAYLQANVLGLAVSSTAGASLFPGGNSTRAYESVRYQV